MINTCPCMRPQKAVMVFAVVDAVLSLLGLGVLIFALVAVFKLDDDDDLDYEVSSRTIVIIVAVVGAVITLIQLILAFTLFIGAKNNALRVVRIWFIITIVIFVFNIITLIMNIVGGANAGTALAGSIVNIVYKIYELLVVRHFMEVGGGAGGNTFMPSAYPQAQTTTVYATPNPQQAYPMQSYPSAAPPSSTVPYPGSEEPQVGFTYTQPTTVRNELYTGPQGSTFGSGV